MVLHDFLHVRVTLSITCFQHESVLSHGVILLHGFVSQLFRSGFNCMFPDIFSDVRLDPINGDHVFGVCKIECGLVELGLRHKIFQVDPLWLNMPQIVGARVHLAIDERH